MLDFNKQQLPRDFLCAPHSPWMAFLATILLLEQPSHEAAAAFPAPCPLISWPEPRTPDPRAAGPEIVKIATSIQFQSVKRISNLISLYRQHANRVVCRIKGSTHFQFWIFEPFWTVGPSDRESPYSVPISADSAEDQGSLILINWLNQ